VLDPAVKQEQLNSRGPGVGWAVGIATGVCSGVATAAGTATKADGAPGRIGTEGCVSGGGPGGGGGCCARVAPPSAVSTSSVAIATRAHAQGPGKILIAKTISYRNRFSSDKPQVSHARTHAPMGRAAMIRKPGLRCKRAAFGQKCPVYSFRSTELILRNALARGFVFG